MNRLILSSIAFGVAAASAQGAIIDTFETSQEVTANMGNPQSANSVSGPGILGGSRELYAFWDSGPNDIQEVANASDNGTLNYSMGADTIGSGVVVWDGTDGVRGVSVPVDPTGLGGEDLTEMGTHDRLAIRILFDDLPATLTFDVYSDGDNWSQASVALPGSIFAPFLDVEILFSDFAQMGTGPADFSNVGAITMWIEGEFAATDIEIDFIETRVPNPGMLSLAGIAGLVGLRRRR